MKQLFLFFLMAGLLLGLTGCRPKDMEPEEMQDLLDGIVGEVGSSQITSDKGLIGTRVLKDNADTYAGEYTAACESVSGRDVVFGGASIHNRELFLSGTVQTESGKVTVRTRLNEEVFELEPDANGHFETTLKLDTGGNYIMVVYEDFSGTLALSSEYMDDEK